MNTPRLKHLFLALCTAAGLTAGSNAMAIPTADIFKGAFDTRNSSDATELALFETISGLDLTKDDLYRDETVSVTEVSPGLWMLNDAPTVTGYFLLKFGINNTNDGYKTSFDSYVFQNVADFSQLVFSAADVNYLIGGDCSNKNDEVCNATRLSHWTFVAGGDGGSVPGDNGEVPEPASLALLGAGLAGIALRRRRK